MYTMKDVIMEGHEGLATKCKDVVLPISDEDLKVLTNLLTYVISSQNDDTAKKLDLRPAVGIAAPQVNVQKRMFAMVCEDEKRAYAYACVNPIIKKHSKDYVYLPMGEGCLSVEEETTGLVDRYSWVEVESHILNFNTMKLEKKTFKLEGYAAIVFQHEYDHLDGVLFTDKIKLEADMLGKPFEF